MKYGVLVHCLYNHSHWTIPRTQPDGDAKIRGKHHLAEGHLRLSWVSKYSVQVRALLGYML